MAQSLKAEQVGRYKLAVVELDDEDLAKKVAEEATGRDKDLVLVVMGGNKLSIFTGGADVAPIVKSLREVGFRGGGSRTFAQGVYSGDVKTLIDALRRALS